MIGQIDVKLLLALVGVSEVPAVAVWSHVLVCVIIHKRDCLCVTGVVRVIL